MVLEKIIPRTYRKDLYIKTIYNNKKYMIRFLHFFVLVDTHSPDTPGKGTTPVVKVLRKHIYILGGIHYFRDRLYSKVCTACNRNIRKFTGNAHKSTEY